MIVERYKGWGLWILFIFFDFYRNYIYVLGI